jgi:hypothetical protein
LEGNAFMDGYYVARDELKAQLAESERKLREAQDDLGNGMLSPIMMLR